MTYAFVAVVGLAFGLAIGFISGAQFGARVALSRENVARELDGYDR